MGKRGWFVADWTSETRVDTRAAAVALASQTGALVIRECECGCGKPAGKSDPKATRDARRKHGG